MNIESSQDIAWWKHLPKLKSDHHKKSPMEQGYENYLKIPKAKTGKSSEIYSKNWIVFIGLSCFPPHPHRYFTIEEFVCKCAQDEELYNRFIQPLI